MRVDAILWMQPKTPSPPAAPRPRESSEPGETVARPEPGLGRGPWEAPAWAFWVALGLVLVAAGAYGLRRMGMLKLPRERAATNDANTPSLRSRR